MFGTLNQPDACWSGEAIPRLQMRAAPLVSGEWTGLSGQPTACVKVQWKPLAGGVAVLVKQRHQHRYCIHSVDFAPEGIQGQPGHRKVGYPKSIRVDQGSEFISRDLDLWAYQKDIVLDFSRPGKPTDNAFIESFNGKFRAECLNTHWFMSLDDARSKLEEWR